ncbi:MAG: HEAT repeat domain-containing protein [Planctomycetota bacterium]|nr:MAG: HEAT repeat domain-containing protein [Planctomycetota bacterium]
MLAVALLLAALAGRAPGLEIDVSQHPLPSIEAWCSFCNLLGQESTQEPKKAKKRQFPRLNASAKNRVEDALLALRTSKGKEAQQQAVSDLQREGAGAVPKCLDYFRKLENEPARSRMRQVLDHILKEEDLDLAHKALGKKADPWARTYIARRFADSRRKDAVATLKLYLKDKDSEVRYQAARGLAFHEQKDGVTELHAFLLQHWKNRHKEFRADFAGVKRGPCSGAILPLLNKGDRNQRLAAVHLFELLGYSGHKASLKPLLDHPDGAIKHATINACRVVIDGDEPLKRPSVFEDIKHAEEWKKRL